MRHMRLEALRRLTAVAGRPASAVDFAKNILRLRQVAVDLDVPEHPVGEPKLLGDEIHDLQVVLGLEDWLDDLVAPLYRAVGGNPRSLGLVAGGGRQQIRAILAFAENRPGSRMRVADDQEFQFREG